jgi:hypothetical protein
LPGPRVARLHHPVFQDAHLEPFLYQVDDAPVADPVLQETHQPFLADGVEERSNVGVQYPVHLLAVDPDHERVKRIMRAASRPEPIREPEEVFLVDRVEHRSRRPLDDLVLQRRDREWTLPAVRFWDVNPP